MIQEVVYKQIKLVAQQQNKKLPPLTDDLRLIESGLDSLCIAILIANLEDELRLDPFGSGDDVEFPVTVGDLVRIYEAAAVHAT